jgi:hypothetical protein
MSCASLWSASARDQRHFWNDDAHTLAAWCHTWNIFVKQHGMQKGNSLVLDRPTRRLFPFIYGDGGYQGPKAVRAAAKPGMLDHRDR